MSSIKIAFVGTSCTGKTTLLTNLKEELGFRSNVAFVEEAARAYFTQHPHITDRFSHKTQEAVQLLARVMEEEAHNKNADLIFCDRSVLDAVAYVKACGDLKGAEELYNNMSTWIPTYHTIFLLSPLEIAYQTDAVRTEDNQTRMRFHRAFVSLFKEKNIPYRLLKGTFEERLHEVKSIIYS